MTADDLMNHWRKSVSQARQARRQLERLRREYAACRLAEQALRREVCRVIRAQPARALLHEELLWMVKRAGSEATHRLVSRPAPAMATTIEVVLTATAECQELAPPAPATKLLRVVSAEPDTVTIWASANRRQGA